MIGDDLKTYESRSDKEIREDDDTQCIEFEKIVENTPYKRWHCYTLLDKTCYSSEAQYEWIVNQRRVEPHDRMYNQLIITGPYGVNITSFVDIEDKDLYPTLEQQM